MRHGNVLNVNRADPFPARLDHILAAIRNLHEPVFVNGGYIACWKPTV